MEPRPVRWSGPRARRRHGVQLLCRAPWTPRRAWRRHRSATALDRADRRANDPQAMATVRPVRGSAARLVMDARGWADCCQASCPPPAWPPVGERLSVLMSAPYVRAGTVFAEAV